MKKETATVEANVYYFYLRMADGTIRLHRRTEPTKMKVEEMPKTFENEEEASDYCLALNEGLQ